MTPQQQGPEDTPQQPAPDYEWAEFNLPSDLVAAGSREGAPADAS